MQLSEMINTKQKSELLKEADRADAQYIARLPEKAVTPVHREGYEKAMPCGAFTAPFNRILTTPHPVRYVSSNIGADNIVRSLFVGEYGNTLSFDPLRQTTLQWHYVRTYWKALRISVTNRPGLHISVHGWNLRRFSDEYHELSKFTLWFD